MGIISGGVAKVWMWQHALAQDISCEIQLGREFQEAIVTRDNSFAPGLPFAAAQFRCLTSGLSYIYRPVDGKRSFRGDNLNGRTTYRMVAWCPTPCHHGCRAVLLECGIAGLVEEDTFQAAARDGYRLESSKVR